LFHTTTHVVYWLGRRAVAAIAQIRHQVEEYCMRAKTNGERHNEYSFIPVSPTSTSTVRHTPRLHQFSHPRIHVSHPHPHVHPRTHHAHLRPSSPTPFTHPVPHPRHEFTIHKYIQNRTAVRSEALQWRSAQYLAFPFSPYWYTHAEPATNKPVVCCETINVWVQLINFKRA
jgi:hypothetical protein